MSSENPKVEKIIQTIQYAVSQEFSDFDTVTICYRNDDIETALKESKLKIPSRRAAAEIFNKIDSIKNAPERPIHFIGIARNNEKNILPFLSRESSLAGFIIDADADAYESETHTAEDFHAALWHALKLHDNLNKDEKDTFSFENGIYHQKISDFKQARHNMLADAFAGFALQLTGNEDMLQHLAEHRCHMTMGQYPGYDSCMYPYPIALDASFLVYEDMKNKPGKADGPLSHAYDMSIELDHTCNDQIITQWQSFAENAQKMAWSNAETKHILGAAIYSCENAYDRSTGYLVSDILNIDPVPLTHFNGLNPFADNELQERNHIRAQKENFKKIYNHQLSYEDKNARNIFFQAAFSQCQTLLFGNPIGWSAPALVKTGLLYEDCRDDEDLEEKLSEIYFETNETVKWAHIRKIHDTLIELRRTGRTVTIDTLIRLLEEIPDIGDAPACIKKLRQIFKHRL